jgi:hypothetical protein
MAEKYYSCIQINSVYDLICAQLIAKLHQTIEVNINIVLTHNSIVKEIVGCNTIRTIEHICCSLREYINGPVEHI